MWSKVLPFIKRYFFLGILLIAFISFFSLHLSNYLTITTLKDYQHTVQQWAITHYSIAIIVYMLIFAILIACTIPCATFLTLVGGFLFGNIAFFYALFSTTLGGFILFFAIRNAVGTRIINNSRGWIKKFEHGFQENAFNYLLTLRLIPIFPCWISNITAGLLDVPIKTFLTATIIGVAPSTLIYAMAGRGLGKILSNEKMPIAELIFTPSIILPLFGLALLSIAPVIYKSIKKSH
jgi:uncharacterized membrane protein YdjX (TVP38/TMEM64 family)